MQRVNDALRVCVRVSTANTVEVIIMERPVVSTMFAPMPIPEERVLDVQIAIMQGYQWETAEGRKALVPPGSKITSDDPLCLVPMYTKNARRVWPDVRDRINDMGEIPDLVASQIWLIAITLGVDDV